MKARREAVAGLLLAATGLACLWIVTYSERTTLRNLGRKLLFYQPVFRYTPGWTIPLAIVIGLGGVFLVLLLFRPRLIRR